MRYRIVLLVLLIATRLTGYVNAAPPADEKWFFAQTPTQVIAYTADGDTNILLETVSIEGVSAYRLDDQSAVALLEIRDVVLDENTTKRLYYLTPESATLVSTNLDLNDTSLIFHSQSGSYVFFFDGITPPATTGLFLNLDTLALEPLSENLIYANWQTVRFSEDGQFLRYVRQEAEESWTIRERTLATGEERVIYPLEDEFFPNLTADSSGENWMYSTVNTETRVRTLTLIHQDGTVETLAEENLAESAYRVFFNDSLLIVPLLCEADCRLELKPLSGEESTFYSVPSTDVIVSPQRQLDNGDLLVYTPDDSAFLATGNGWISAATWFLDPQQVFTPLNEMISPDGRWLAVMNAEDDPTGYKVWDTQNAEFVLENDFHEDGFSFLQVYYGEGGFVLWESGKYSYAHGNSDQPLLELPAGDERNYFTVLADGQLLYYEFSQPRSIYRYDPDTQTETLLVENGIPMVR